jgi:hypothetical protein
LRTIARASGISEDEAVKGAGHREIVRGAGKSSVVGADLALALWQGCSGLTHGDIWATFGMLDRTVQQHPTLPGVLHARVTASTGGLIMALLVTTMMVSRGFELFDRRSLPPY